MSKALAFVTEVESGNLLSVQNLLLKGFDANTNYLGVFPLVLATEQGDADMAALLLTAGADPLLRGNGKNVKNAGQLADSMATDPKCQLRAEAKLILELINDPAVLKARFNKVQEKVQAQHKREMRRIRQTCIGLWVGLPLALLVYWFVFRKLRVDQEL